MTNPDQTPSLRILQLCAVDFTVRQFIAPLALELEKDGHLVQCACTPGPHWEELADMGVSMVPMPIARSANPVRALGSVLRLYKWLRREKPDVLHVHTPVASMVGRLAGWLAGVPLIIYTAHGFYFHDRMTSSQRRKHVMMERCFAPFHDALFCVSREDARNAAKLRMARHGRVFFVSNGVYEDQFNPDSLPQGAGDDIRAQFSIPSEAKVVMIMGRMVREKGYLEFFEAMASIASRYPHLHVLVVGDTVVSEHDAAKEEIQEAATHPDLAGRVHFAGLRRDIPELLAASDIFCLPSWREGMPVSIIEAMMMGLPVVATRIRGSREEVIDGETGFLVEPRDPKAMAGAIAWLLDNGEVAREMGKSGRRRALRYFNARRIYDRQRRLYRHLWKRVGKR
ncbi:MAG: glycosyltransferase family 4 protein [Candidatus Sumerlaeia bacterium]|nr:glycosyltransferase family 4 protein [Candidatus Sumerlaeia bacterium]